MFIKWSTDQITIKLGKEKKDKKEGEKRIKE